MYFSVTHSWAPTIIEQERRVQEMMRINHVPQITLNMPSKFYEPCKTKGKNMVSYELTF